MTVFEQEYLAQMYMELYLDKINGFISIDSAPLQKSYMIGIKYLNQPADHTHTFKRDFRETEEFYQNPYRSGAAVMETKGRGKKRSSL